MLAMFTSKVVNLNVAQNVNITFNISQLWCMSLEVGNAWFRVGTFNWDTPSSQEL